MKKLYLNTSLIFSLILSMASCSKSQKLTQIPQEANVSLFDFMWKINPEEIKIFDTNSEYFYKSIIIREPEGSLTMEGEVLDRLYIMKGEYGEYPDGKLFDCGTYFNVMNISLNEESGTLTIKSGSIIKPKLTSIKVP